MRANIYRYLLAVLLCGFSAAGWSGVLFSQDFSSCASNIPPSIEGWTFYHCNCINGLWPLSLRIEKDNKEGKEIGYFITEPINYAGNVQLTFKMGTSENNGTCSVKVSVSKGSVISPSDASSSASVQTPMQTYTYNLLVERGATIRFDLTSDKKYAMIDDIVVSTDGITLDEQRNYQDAIDGAVGNTIDVRTKRTLTGGIWNTLCLPFDVTKATMEQALGANQDIQMCTYSSYANEEMTFSDATESTITAGTPFIIKLNNTVTNPTFHTVTVKDTPAQAIDHGGVRFVGTYSPVDLTTDGNNLFITKTNLIAKPATGGTQMYGLRAYIDLTSGSGSSPARITFGDSDATTITTTKYSQTPATLYDLSGRRRPANTNSRRGLSIADGRLILTK